MKTQTYGVDALEHLISNPGEKFLSEIIKHEIELFRVLRNS